MGDANEPKKTELAQGSEEMMVAQAMGGRMHVRWGEAAQATPHGGVVFCAELPGFEPPEPDGLTMIGAPEGANAVVTGNMMRRAIQGLGEIAVSVGGCHE